jgi:hypothetical protein
MKFVQILAAAASGLVVWSQAEREVVRRNVRSGGIMTTAVCLSSRLLLGTAVARKCVELFDAALVVALLDSTDSFSWLPSICWGGVGCSALRSGLASCVV